MLSLSAFMLCCCVLNIKCIIEEKKFTCCMHNTVLFNMFLNPLMHEIGRA